MSIKMTESAFQHFILYAGRYITFQFQYYNPHRKISHFTLED